MGYEIRPLPVEQWKAIRRRYKKWCESEVHHEREAILKALDSERLYNTTGEEWEWIRDLDDDGWRDVLVELTRFGRRVGVGLCSLVADDGWGRESRSGEISTVGHESACLELLG